jgi:hypothetical protein
MPQRGGGKESFFCGKKFTALGLDRWELIANAVTKKMWSMAS